MNNYTKSDSVVFSLALNGYGRAYEDCLESHKNYARRVGIDLIHFRAKVACSAAFCAWLKLPMMIELFDVGYTNVFYVDADCALRENAPRFTDAMVPDASIFMAQGWSGRLNSGVVMARETDLSRRAFGKIIDDCSNCVPEASQAQYENGHVIRWLSDSPDLKVLSSGWNSIQLHKKTDFVWHFTGPNSRVCAVDRSKPSLPTKAWRLVKKWAPRIIQGARSDVNPQALRATARYLVEKQTVLGGEG